MYRKIGVLLLLICLGVGVVHSVLESRREAEEVDRIASKTQTRLDKESLSLVSAIPIAVRNGGYLGSDACRQCHQEHDQSWHESYHRTMTQVISSETAPDAIRDGEVIVQSVHELPHALHDLRASKVDSFAHDLKPIGPFDD